MIRQRLARGVALIGSGMALLFLCKFALAQNLQPDWISDTKTGCKIWDNEPAPNESVTWSGGCKSGFATGFGVLVWFANGKFEERDVGVLLHGQQNGQDTQTFSNGDKSTGEWINGVQTGEDTYIFSNGNIVVGVVDKGHFIGNVKEIYADGDKYVGPFSDYNSNEQQGVETLVNGNKYTGEFKNGQFSGVGTETYPSGNKYVGEFADGLFNGQGTYTTAHGFKYVGEFKDGNFSGQGTETFSSGGKHVGEFRNNQYDGPGTEIYVDGSRYVGEWLNDKRNGQGTLYSSNGKVVHSGIWKNDVFVATEPTSSAAIPNIAPIYSGGRDEIPIVSRGGVFEIPVDINGAITLNFIIDSGSADVSIPVDVVLVMLRTGTLTSNDFLGTANYTLADGSTVPSQEFRIRSLKVGDRVFDNIVGSVENVNAPLLLGQSFLSRLKSWSIDNNKHALELQN